MDKYLVRTARFRVLEGSIVASDPRQPRVITMDPWPQKVFANADGEHTVREFFEAVAGMYDGNPPPGLEEAILEAVEDLVSEGLIELTEAPRPLPPELLHPIPDGP